MCVPLCIRIVAADRRLQFEEEQTFLRAAAEGDISVLKDLVRKRYMQCITWMCFYLCKPLMKPCWERDRQTNRQRQKEHTG